MKRQQKGFGLLELLVVIAVIGVIASLSIAAYQQYIIRAQVTEGIVLSNGVRQVIIDEYLETGDWEGKAGAYAIQGPAGAFIPWISGSYTAIMGLPAHETAMLLTSAGYPVFGGTR